MAREWATQCGHERQSPLSRIARCGHPLLGGKEIASSPPRMSLRVGQRPLPLRELGAWQDLPLVVVGMEEVRFRRAGRAGAAVGRDYRCRRDGFEPVHVGQWL